MNDYRFEHMSDNVLELMNADRFKHMSDNGFKTLVIMNVKKLVLMDLHE